jgi:hypothetical protein
LNPDPERVHKNKPYIKMIKIEYLKRKTCHIPWDWVHFYEPFLSPCPLC